MEHKTYRGRLSKMIGNFGFIRCDGKDIFVHFTNYLGGFKPELNQIVEFNIGPSPREDRPPVAIRVRVVKSAAEVEAGFDGLSQAERALRLLKGNGSQGGA